MFSCGLNSAVTGLGIRLLTVGRAVVNRMVSEQRT